LIKIDVKKFSTYTNRAEIVAAGARSSWLGDVMELTKMRLTLMVVFSAIIGYAIAAGGAVQFLPLLILGVGGFCIAGAANAINQILEKDYDALMIRTAGRPVAAGRMQVSEAVVIAGLMVLTGVVLLALFNPLASFLGMLSFILYAFLYTPMKRYGTLSVAVGAIPGALPVVIGCVAYEGTISWLALVLFTIQFLWQFPHFWSIGFLSFDQYQKAGFKLVPASPEGGVHTSLGLHALIYALLLLPVCVLSLWFGVTGIITTVFIVLISLWYIYRSYQFWRKFDQPAARTLMFTSFAYLPLVLLTILFGGL
jgi:protoheme IX farnesyltransferase